MKSTTQNCGHVAQRVDAEALLQQLTSELLSFPLFDGLPAELAREAAAAGRICRLKKRGMIYLPELQDRNLYFLLRGRVKIVRLAADGREIILDLIGPGGIFGELCLSGEPEIAEESYVETAEALNDVEVLVVPRGAFLRLLMRYPQLTPRLLAHLSAKLRRAEAKLESFAFKDAKQRIARFLFLYAEEFGRIRQRRITVDKFVSQKEIAQSTGTSRQTVAAILNQFKREGLIDFNHRQLVIHELETIRALFA